MASLIKRFDFRISLGYAVVAALWILLSDAVLNFLFFSNPTLLSIVSVLKGWLFVAVTTLALFAALRIELRSRHQMETFLQNEIIASKEILEALRNSENRFAATFHGSPAATCISRRDNARLVEVNDAFARMFGYQREELIGRTSFEIGLWVDPEDRHRALKATAEFGSIHNVEMQGRTKSGTTIDLLASSQAIDLGTEPHIVNIFYDVTEQRKLEEQSRYQALLLQYVSDAVISTDVNFNIRSWNPAATLIFGWKAEEVIGKSAHEIFQGESPNATDEDILNEFNATGKWSGEVIHRRKDGSRVYLLASSTFVYDKTGHHIGIVSVNRDITEQMKVQQEKQEAARLRMELDKQTELLRLKEDFISIVSHEFRTPLTVIMASSEMLQTYHGRMPAERQQKHFQVIFDQTKYMAGLIDDVLTVNKARAGKLEFNPVPMRLESFCQDALARFNEVDKGKHNIVFTHTGDISEVSLDAKLLEHILINLLSNAIKYSPNGGEVRLEIERFAEEIVFRVSDQGIGIPAESLPHLYEPFYRAKNTGDIGGTGLGTAIVKESVDFHQGTIHYASNVGVGTTVTVRLPVHNTASPATS